MIHVLIAILLIPAAAWLDRQRGTSPETEIIAKLPALIGLGLCNSFFVVDHGASIAIMVAQMAIVIAAVAAAYNWPGLGEPVGHALTGEHRGNKYQDWQFGKLKTNPWMALVFYGSVFFPACLILIWAIDGALSHFSGVQGVPASWVLTAAAKLGIAHSIAWPGACAIVRYVLRIPAKNIEKYGGAWGMQEYLRGALSMIALGAIYSIT
jgi:hypothetical protein